MVLIMMSHGVALAACMADQQLMNKGGYIVWYRPSYSDIGTKTPLAPTAVSPIATCTGGVIV